MSMHVQPVMITTTIQIGATGAVTSFAGSAVKSVTRSGTGLYLITLQPNTQFPNLYYANGAMQSPASGLSGIGAIEVQNVPNATVSLLAGGQLTIKTLSVAGALADPATGSAITVMMLFSNSSVTIPGG